MCCQLWREKQNVTAYHTLYCCFWHPSKCHKNFLLGVESSTGDSKKCPNHSDDQCSQQHCSSQDQSLRIYLVDLDLSSDEGEDDGLKDDPHLVEDV